MVVATGAQGSEKGCEVPVMNVNSSVTISRHSGCHLLYGDKVPGAVISEHCLLHRPFAAV